MGCASFVPRDPVRAKAKARHESQVMSASSETVPGLPDRSQEPKADIPTEPEAFLRWAVSLDRHHPFKYELSRGKVSRMMINVSRAHWQVTANILGGLLQKLDRTRSSLVQPSSVSGQGLASAIQTSLLIASVQVWRTWHAKRRSSSSKCFRRGIPDAPTVE